MVKDRVVTRYDEVLGNVESPDSEAIEPEGEQPGSELSISQQAAVSGPWPTPIRPSVPTDYGYFDDLEEAETGEETQEDHKLKQVMETVKAPNLAVNLGDLLKLAPIIPEAEGDLATLAHRLSPDELVNRLAPLFAKPDETIDPVT